MFIIKSFVFSVIGYEIEMRGISEKYEKEINYIMWDFIWDCKRNKAARAVCCRPKEKRGTGMVNRRNFIRSKQDLHNLTIPLEQTFQMKILWVTQTSRSERKPCISTIFLKAG